MLDELDVPNVDEAVEAMCDDATTASWERIKKKELLEPQTTDVQQLKAEIAAILDQMKVYQPHIYAFLESGYINKLRQLSAV